MLQNRQARILEPILPMPHTVAPALLPRIFTGSIARNANLPVFSLLRG